MNVGLHYLLSDSRVDCDRPVNQRQLVAIVRAVPPATEPKLSLPLPLHLCLLLDQSSSMGGEPLAAVKQAALQLVEQLSPQDRLSLVAFDHRAKVLVANQVIAQPEAIKAAIASLAATGGTCLDEGLEQALKVLTHGRLNSETETPEGVNWVLPETVSQISQISQIILLTDGDNEHGSDRRCLELAEQATEHQITLNVLGFGDHWNPALLESLVDRGRGCLAYIPQPHVLWSAFNQIFQRIQTVGLTQASLHLELASRVRLATYKPIAQVAPETIELQPQLQRGKFSIHLGDLMTYLPRAILVNFYLDALPPGVHTIARLQVRYHHPYNFREEQRYDWVPVEIEAIPHHHFTLDPAVEPYLLALAKYRQVQIAELHLQRGDRQGAVTLLQSAADTAIQMGDFSGATLLQAEATRLQEGEELSPSDRKRHLIVSKTRIQGFSASGKSDSALFLPQQVQFPQNQE